MRHLRLGYCGFALMAAILALAQHLGFDLWNCASCSFVSELPLSPIIAWIGPPALGVLLVGFFKDKSWARTGNIVASGGSLVLLGWMLSHSSICKLCVLVHLGVLASAITFVPRPKVLAPLFFSLGIIFTATGGWDRFSSISNEAIFRPREGEAIPTGKVFVLFTDPECSRCRMIEEQISKLGSKPKIIHRWMLLPGAMYRTIRAASMSEMIRIAHPDKEEAFRNALLATTPPILDSSLLVAAAKVGVGGRAKEWLEHPSEKVLIDIEGDQTSSHELKIQSLPALAELMPPDPTGTRMLKNASFSAIGLNP